MCNCNLRYSERYEKLVRQLTEICSHQYCIDWLYCGSVQDCNSAAVWLVLLLLLIKQGQFWAKCSALNMKAGGTYSYHCTLHR